MCLTCCFSSVQTLFRTVGYPPWAFRWSVLSFNISWINHWITLQSVYQWRDSSRICVSQRKYICARKTLNNPCVLNRRMIQIRVYVCNASLSYLCFVDAGFEADSVAWFDGVFCVCYCYVCMCIRRSLIFQFTCRRYCSMIYYCCVYSYDGWSCPLYSALTGHSFSSEWFLLSVVHVVLWGVIKGIVHLKSPPFRLHCVIKENTRTWARSVQSHHN